MGSLPQHSAIEFRRYMIRFLYLFGDLWDMTGVMRTPINQHQAFIEPLVAWLRPRGGNKATVDQPPWLKLFYEESDSNERLRVSNWIVQRLYHYAIKELSLIHIFLSNRAEPGLSLPGVDLSSADRCRLCEFRGRLPSCRHADR